MQQVDWMTAENWLRHGALLAVYIVAGERRARILNAEEYPVGRIDPTNYERLVTRVPLRIKSKSPGGRRTLMEYAG